MYSVGVLGEFEAAVHMVGDFGDACRLHGHTYQVEIVLRGEKDKRHGVVYDIGLLKRELDRVLKTLNYYHLNELGSFKDINPTVENIAEYIFHQLTPKLSTEPNLEGLCVKVWENSFAYAAFDGFLR